MEQALGGVFVVGQAGALEGVALDKMLKGSRRVANIVQSLGQREMDKHRATGGLMPHVCRQGFKGGQVWIAGLKSFEIGTVVMGFGIVGSDGHCPLKGCLGFDQLPLFPEDMAAIVPGFGQFRLECQGLLVFGQGGCAVAQGHQHIAKIQVSFGVGRQDRQGSLIQGHGFG